LEICRGKLEREKREEHCNDGDEDYGQLGEGDGVEGWGELGERRRKNHRRTWGWGKRRIKIQLDSSQGQVSDLLPRLLPDRGSESILTATTVVTWDCDRDLAPTPTTATIDNINSNVPIQQLNSHFLATSTSHSSSHLMASLLLPLLHCPLCPSSSPLVVPVTLLCGHTVCAKHVSIPPASHPSPQDHLVPRRLRLTPCPLQGCNASPSNPVPPLNIPSSSRVTIYPVLGPQLDRDPTAFETIPDSRTDVTINKLASIIHRYDQHKRAQHTERLPTLDSSSDGDSQTDEEILDTHASPSAGPSTSEPSSESSIPRPVSSDAPQQGPVRIGAKKRRRKQLPPPRRLDAPAQSADHLEKELLNELTCEICFMLLYQPITSPCQHVRSLSLLFFSH
jgi:hypothetical protein